MNSLKLIFSTIFVAIIVVLLYYKIVYFQTNSQDDNGILVGNWSGDYLGGKSPLDWVGSVKILNDYYKFKRPVRYGQCWVFSGVLTTRKFYFVV